MSEKENRDVRRLPAVQAEYDDLRSIDIEDLKGTVDVTHTGQRIVDGPGDGKTLAIDTVQDLEALLGETNTASVRKHLSVTYQIPGHDAEQMTSSDEITSSGFTRNFIRNRGGTVHHWTRDWAVEPTKDIYFAGGGGGPGGASMGGTSGAHGYE